MSAFWGRNALFATAAIVAAAGCTLSIQLAVAVSAEQADQPGTGGIAVKDLPRVQSEEFRADPYIRAAAQLQSLGKDKAIAALAALASGRDDGGDSDTK